MVALGRFLQHRQMRLQVVAVLEGHAIDALQHGPRRIAQPISARDMGQLEGIGRHLAGVLQMRPTAKILPGAVPVHADILAFGNPVQKFEFERLAPPTVVFHRPCAFPKFGFDRFARIDDLLHPRFDLAQILGREGFGAVEIVEPAVVTDRADGHFHIRPDLLHRPRHDMREIMADEFKRLGIVLHRVDGDGGVALDRPLQIPVFAIHRRRNGLFREAGRNRRRHFACGHARGEIALIAIGESQGNLAHRPSSSSVWRPRNARLRVGVARFSPLGGATSSGQPC